MGKILKGILFSTYLLIVLLVTLLLLSYNEFKVTEIGTYSLLLITDNELAPIFNKGDLIIVNKDKDILEGQKAFFYDVYNDKIEVKLGTIQKVEKVAFTENTYIFEGERKISGDYILGAANECTIIPKLGGILNILESKWGFLFIIVFPVLIISINQITIVGANIIKAYKETILEDKQNKKQGKDD